MTATDQSTAHPSAAAWCDGGRRPGRPAGRHPARPLLKPPVRPVLSRTVRRPAGRSIGRVPWCAVWGAVSGRCAPRPQDHAPGRTGVRGRERGMVTAEIAVALPALVALTLGLVCVIAAVGAQLRCADLAREAARALARGESTASVRSRVLGDAPPRASLGVRRSGGMVTATVTATAPVIGIDLLRVPGVRVHSRATAADEKSLAEQPW